MRGIEGGFGWKEEDEEEEEEEDEGKWERAEGFRGAEKLCHSASCIFNSLSPSLHIVMCSSKIVCLRNK